MQTVAVPSYDDILRLFQETALRFEETDRMLKESIKQTDERFKETAREIKAVNDATNKSIGRLTNRLDQFVEEAVRPAAVTPKCCAMSLSIADNVPAFIGLCAGIVT